MSSSILVRWLVMASVLVIAGCGGPPTINDQGGTVLVWSAAKNDASGQPVELNSELQAAMLPALEQRVRMVAGIPAVVVTPAAGSDKAFRIELPGVFDSALIEQVRQAIAAAGNVEFLIIANYRHHEALSNAVEGMEPAPQQLFVGPADAPLGKWLRVAPRAGQQGGFRIDPAAMPEAIFRDGTTGKLISADEALKVGQLQILAVVEDRKVSGADFAEVLSTIDVNSGSPAISFTLAPEGAKNMAILTARYTSNLRQEEYHHLGIVFDDEVISAPRLSSAIAGEGIITGNFTREEVNFIAGILRSGSLPARMEPQPDSEQTVQPD